MVFKYIILLSLLLLVFILIYFNSNLSTCSLYIRLFLIKKSMNKCKKMNNIIYLVNKNAGLANTLRGMSSSIYLSYFCKSRFFLKGWNSIIFYFDYPQALLYDKEIRSSYVRYRFFNNIILDKLKANCSILLTDIHGFTNYIISKFLNSKEMTVLKNIYSIKKINGIILNNLIYREIFIPSKSIEKYIKIFNKIKNKRKVLGIHIRSGIFKNNFSENYFTKYFKLKEYFSTSLLIIKNNNISYIFSISDNRNNLNEINHYYKKMIININFKGEVMHSKFSLYDENLNSNAIRIVSEFILLSNCDIIIGTKRSSFSAEACRRMVIKRCYFV